LFLIGAAIVWAAAVEFLSMMGKGSASIEDILLLFIYLELGAVVGIYFQTNHMPVRFLIYVAITALTRLLLELVFDWHNTAYINIIIVCGGILLLATSILVLRYASHHYPSK
jgi:phosphate starvation-inducible membrane PsiE